jgi:hypothetical protein
MPKQGITLVGAEEQLLKMFLHWMTMILSVHIIYSSP